MGSCLSPWLVRHAAWLITRYLVGSGDRTVRQRISTVPEVPRIVESSEIAGGLLAAGYQRAATLRDLTLAGDWVGRTVGGDEHILLAERGALRFRSIRRRDPQQRSGTELFSKSNGLPLDLRRESARPITHDDPVSVRRATGWEPGTAIEKCENANLFR